MSEIGDSLILFIGGLHRSGTSPLHRALSSHPDISCFADTGKPEDEGQHLQSVYPPARTFGGAGRFGFYAEAHMTEDSPLNSEENRAKILAQWSRYWDTSRAVLVEKSPPNIIRSRFLQTLHPRSCFIFIMRHPVPTALATMKWARTSLTASIEHWILCHDILMKDLESIRNYFLFRYEDFVENPKIHAAEIAEFLGLQKNIDVQNIENRANDRYLLEWGKLKTNRSPMAITLEKVFRKIVLDGSSIGLDPAAEIADIEYRFEANLNRYGYSFQAPAGGAEFKRVSRQE